MTPRVYLASLPVFCLICHICDFLAGLLLEVSPVSLSLSVVGFYGFYVRPLRLLIKNYEASLRQTTMGIRDP